MNKIGIFYFRSLYSQSAASLSVGKFSHYLLNRGYNTKLFLLRQNSHYETMCVLNNLLKCNFIIYKTNFKDFEYGIRLLENLANNYNKKIYLIGPFALINKDSILKKYKFIDDIINLEDSEKLESIFPCENKIINKKTVICGVDREVEFNEHGKYINLEASTGCIYNCSFCHINIMKYAKSEKNIELLVDEIEEIIKKMNKRYFIFNDSVFWKNNKDNDRIYKFIDCVIKRNIKFNFMIYLSITNKINDELLMKLKEIGLIRVFFGVENISRSFSIQNNKYISSFDSKEFIAKMNKMNISYHIGFILFSPSTKYNELHENIAFLYELKKLFRIGILVEKMRILPGAKDSYLLHLDETKIDQAYNYDFNDKKTALYYETLKNLFNNINIRKFEQFFTGIDIAYTILKDRKKAEDYNDYIVKYQNIKNYINDTLYQILIDELKNLVVKNKEIEMLYNIYSMAEFCYIEFMNKLKECDRDIFEQIPHGNEELNVW